MVMKKVFLAITGSIAAIKSFELIKTLHEKNFTVQCIVSSGGKKFCSSDALEAMTGFPVLGPKIFSYLKKENPFEKNTTEIYAHLQLSRESIAMIIAPCSANTLAKIANGSADDFLSTALLAYENPILIAPAMNTKMWKNSITQKNIEKISALKNFSIVPPKSEGILACGEEGSGKMASTEDILLYLSRTLQVRSKAKKSLVYGKKILINLGGTREKIDPVRYLGNFSSGGTGKIFAEQCFIHGAKNISVMQGISTVSLSETIFDIKKTSSAQEMYRAMEEKFLESDIIIFCAAVADFKAKNFSNQKIKKLENNSSSPEEGKTLELEKNIDIAKTFANQKLPHQIFIGFTLETQGEEFLKASMIQKSQDKKFDIVFGNTPENFNTTYGKFLVYWAKKNKFEEYQGSKENIFSEVLAQI